METKIEESMWRNREIAKCEHIVNLKDAKQNEKNSAIKYKESLEK